MELEATWGGVDIASADDGDIINDWKGPAGSPRTQDASAMRRQASGVFNRGNIKHALSFTVRRPPFGSPLLAAQFTVDHALALQAITDNPDFLFSIGDKDYALRKAVVTGREVNTLFGTSVEHAYTVVGGLLEDVTTP
jgi:hypothetical protein